MALAATRSFLLSCASLALGSAVLDASSRSLQPVPPSAELTYIWRLGTGCMEGLNAADPPITFDPSPYASRLGIWTLPNRLPPGEPSPGSVVPGFPDAAVTSAAIDLCASRGNPPPGSPGFYVGASCRTPVPNVWASRTPKTFPIPGSTAAGTAVWTTYAPPFGSVLPACTFTVDASTTYTLYTTAFEDVTSVATSPDALWFGLSGGAPFIELTPTPPRTPGGATAPAYVFDACLSMMILGFPDPLPYPPKTTDGSRSADYWLSTNNQKIGLGIMPAVSLDVFYSVDGIPGIRFTNVTTTPSFAPCSGPPVADPQVPVSGLTLVLAPPPPPGCAVQPIHTVCVTSLLTPFLPANVATGPLLSGVDIICAACSLDPGHPAFVLRPGASPSLNPFYDSRWTYVLSATDPGLVCRYDSKGGFLIAHAYLVPPPPEDFNQRPTFGYGFNISLRMTPPQPASFFTDCMQNILLEIERDVPSGTWPIEFRFYHAALRADPRTAPPPPIDSVTATVDYTRPAGPAVTCPPPASGLTLSPFLFDNFCSIFRKTVEISPGVFRNYDISPFTSLTGPAGPAGASLVTIPLPGTEETTLGWATCVNCKAGGMTADTATGPNSVGARPRVLHWGPSVERAACLIPLYSPCPGCTDPPGFSAMFYQFTVLVTERGRSITAEILPGRFPPETLSLVGPVTVDSAAVAACLRDAVNMTIPSTGGHLMVPLPLPDGSYPLLAHAGGIDSPNSVASFMAPLPRDCLGHTFTIPPTAPRALPADLSIDVPRNACTCPVGDLFYESNVGAFTAISGATPPIAPPPGATTVGVASEAIDLCTGFPLTEGAIVCPATVLAEYVDVRILPDTASVPGVVTWSDIRFDSPSDPTRVTRATCTYAPTGSSITVENSGLCYPPPPFRCRDPNVWYAGILSTDATTVIEGSTFIGSNVVAAAEAYDACARAVWVTAKAPAAVAIGDVALTVRVTLGINATVVIPPTGPSTLSMNASFSDSFLTYHFGGACGGPGGACARRSTLFRA